jgi:hypothetical protein
MSKTGPPASANPTNTLTVTTTRPMMTSME